MNTALNYQLASRISQPLASQRLVDLQYAIVRHLHGKNLVNTKTPTLSVEWDENAWIIADWQTDRELHPTETTIDVGADLWDVEYCHGYGSTSKWRAEVEASAEFVREYAPMWAHQAMDEIFPGWDLEGRSEYRGEEMSDNEMIREAA